MLTRMGLNFLCVLYVEEFMQNIWNLKNSPLMVAIHKQFERIPFVMKLVLKEYRILERNRYLKRRSYPIVYFYKKSFSICF